MGICRDEEYRLYENSTSHQGRLPDDFLLPERGRVVG